MNVNENRLKAQLLIATVVVISGLIAMFMGLWMPPIGEIDPTVLTAIGECFTFAGALIGVDYHYRFKQKIDGGGQ